MLLTKQDKQILYKLYSEYLNRRKTGLSISESSNFVSGRPALISATPGSIKNREFFIFFVIFISFPLNLVIHYHVLVMLSILFS